jgi:hypothetical protein
VEVVWECAINAILAKDPNNSTQLELEMQEFYANYREIVAPMDPRKDAFYGGK